MRVGQTNHGEETYDAHCLEDGDLPVLFDATDCTEYSHSGFRVARVPFANSTRSQVSIRLRHLPCVTLLHRDACRS